MSRAPVKPPAQKAPETKAGASKLTPSKRAPKRAVAVAADKETVAPGHVSARAKPKSSRDRMLESQKALHAIYEKPAMREWEDTHFPKDYATENAEARRRANRDTISYAFVVIGIVAVVCVYVFWWSWK